MPNLTNKHILTIIVSAVLLTLLVLVGFYATRDKEATNQIFLKEATNQIPLEEQHWFQDPMSCADLQDQEQDVCYQNKAVSEHDPSYCAKIKTDDVFVSEDACYNQIASLTKDQTICQKIKKQEFKENCLEVISGAEIKNTDQCLGEGEYGVPEPNSSACCAGLTSISCDNLNTNGKCSQCDGTFICTKCGDGLCGQGENKCNCGKDCL